MDDDGRKRGLIDGPSGLRLEVSRGADLPTAVVLRSIPRDGDPVSVAALVEDLELAREEVASAIALLHNNGLILRRTGGDGTPRYVGNPRHREFVAADRYVRTRDRAEVDDLIDEELARERTVSDYFDAESPAGVDVADADDHEEIHERIDDHSEWVNARYRLLGLRLAREMLDSDDWTTADGERD